MIKNFKLVGLAIASLLIFCSASSIADTATDPVTKDKIASDNDKARAIMMSVLNRDDGTSEVSRQRLSSCRYGVKNKKIVCIEKPRVKRLDGVRKDYGQNEKDRRFLSILLDPPSERGIGFLQYDYEEQGKEADQWIYLSALGKVKRIVSSNEDEPKQGSFFGSEFSYEDMEQRHIDDYRYSLVQSENYRGRACWAIESIPTKAHARKSNYSKSLSWVDKERHLILKAILFNRQGKKEKRLTAEKVKSIDGIWVAHSLTINNLLTKRMSNISLERVGYNHAINDDFLTLRTLTDGAFRETTLRSLRKILEN